MREKTSMYLKLIQIIYGDLFVANAFPYGIVLFIMSHLIVLFYLLNMPSVSMSWVMNLY